MLVYDIIIIIIIIFIISVIVIVIIIQVSAENLPENKPRYVMGVGHQVWEFHKNCFNFKKILETLYVNSLKGLKLNLKFFSWKRFN